jgi:hypothetical protein
MLAKILSLFIFVLSLNAYELPTVKIENTTNPKIILFNAKSVLVNEKLSYLLTWKTNNATKVKLTYIGEVKLNGEITITQEEYNRGPITLIASSSKTKKIDSVTINKVNTDLPAPVKFKKPKEVDELVPSQHYYNRPLRNPYNRPYNHLPRRSY